MNEAGERESTLTCNDTVRLEYHMIGSTSDVPQSVAVDTEKYNILRKSKVKMTLVGAASVRTLLPLSLNT